MSIRFEGVVSRIRAAQLDPPSPVVIYFTYEDRELNKLKSTFPKDFSTQVTKLSISCLKDCFLQSCSNTKNIYYALKMAISFTKLEYHTPY